MEKSELKFCRRMSDLVGRKLIVCCWVPVYLDLQINKAALTVARGAGVHVYHHLTEL